MTFIGYNRKLDKLNKTSKSQELDNDSDDDEQENEESCYFVWHTVGGACSACQELDGEVFYSEDDIPDRPHPNCLCWVEYYDGKKSNKEDVLGEILFKRNKLAGDASSLKEEVEGTKTEIQGLEDGVLKGSVEEWVDYLDILKSQISDTKKNSGVLS